MINLSRDITFLTKDNQSLIRNISDRITLGKEAVLESELKKSQDLYRAYAYECCMNFNLNTEIISREPSGILCLLYYEVCRLFKLGKIEPWQFKFLSNLIIEEVPEKRLKNKRKDEAEMSKIVNKCAKEICTTQGIVFTNPLSKNSLFRVTENIYKLYNFPIMSSAAMLSKRGTSLDVDFEEFSNDKITRVHLVTMQSLVKRLRNSKSYTNIFGTLFRFLSVYPDSNLNELFLIVSKNDYDNICNKNNSPRVQILIKELLNEFDKYLVKGKKSALNGILQTTNKIKFECSR